MKEIVLMDLPIEKISMSTDDAVKAFAKYGMHDKEKLFRFRRHSSVNVYSIDGFKDYYYGYMVPSTGYIKYFKLFPYNEGFVIQFPEKNSTKTIPEFTPQNKLFYIM